MSSETWSLGAHCLWSFWLMMCRGAHGYFRTLSVGGGSIATERAIFPGSSSQGCMLPVVSDWLLQWKDFAPH